MLLDYEHDGRGGHERPADDCEEAVKEERSAFTRDLLGLGEGDGAGGVGDVGDGVARHLAEQRVGGPVYNRGHGTMWS